MVKQAVGVTRADIEAGLSMALPNSPMAGANLRVAGGNYLVARPMGVRDGVDMQSTGQTAKIDTPGIHARLDAGELVMLSTLGYSPSGEIFNLTLEEVAAATAIALKAEKFDFFIDTRPRIQDQHDGEPSSEGPPARRSSFCKSTPTRQRRGGTPAAGHPL